MRRHAAAKRNLPCTPGCTLSRILLTLPAPGDAQDRRPLREARSENGRYRLRIDAGREESRRCRAALFEHTRPQERGRRLWREKLVNEVAPRHALIRNDGRFVITLDEFRRRFGRTPRLLNDILS